MLYAFIGFERIPVFRFDIHVGKYSLELEFFGSANKAEQCDFVRP